MARVLTRIIMLAILLGAGFVALAWYDAGREEMHLIEEPVELPMEFDGEAG